MLAEGKDQMVGEWGALRAKLATPRVPSPRF